MTARRNQHADVESQATAVADNTGAGLAFGDKTVVDEIVQALRVRPNIDSVCVYDTKGALFSRLERAGFRCLPAWPAATPLTVPVAVTQAMAGNDPVGTVYPRQLFKPVRLDAAAIGGGFTLTLPRVAMTDAAAASGDSTERPNLSGMRILVVDDDHDSLEIASKALAVTGASVTRALSGFEAVDYWRREPFDILICDLAMPGMDGRRLEGSIPEAVLELSNGAVIGHASCISDRLDTELMRDAPHVDDLEHLCFPASTRWF